VTDEDDRAATGSGIELGVVASEFATVRVTLEPGASGARLRLEDLRSGTVRHLDALELESLVWAPEHWWRRLLDPSLHRWRDAGPGPEIEALSPPDRADPARRSERS
jgi:hypothetical protein